MAGVAELRPARALVAKVLFATSIMQQNGSNKTGIHYACLMIHFVHFSFCTYLCLHERPQQYSLSPHVPREAKAYLLFSEMTRGAITPESAHTQVR